MFCKNYKSFVKLIIKMANKSICRQMKKLCIGGFKERNKEKNYK